MVPIQHYGTSARIAQACYGIWFYIVKTVLPLDITAFYPLPGRIDWLAPPFLLSILGTLAISVGLFLLRRRRPGLLAAWLSYLVILAPNLGFIRVGSQLAADRYSYMAMLGGVMLAAAGLCRLWQSFLGARPGAIGIITVSLGALLGLVLLTWHQCRIWRSSETLWTHALNHGAGRSGLAHYNLGVVRFRQGKFEEAAAHYNEAIRLNPGYAEAHNNLGVVRLRQGKFVEAAAHYNEAIRLDPGYAGPHNNLGVVRFHQGKFAEAAAHYNEAIRLDPDDAESLNNRAMMLAACPEAKYRDGQRAVESATRACELTVWQQPGCLDTLAAAYAEAGDFDAAVGGRPGRSDS